MPEQNVSLSLPSSFFNKCGSIFSTLNTFQFSKIAAGGAKLT